MEMVTREEKLILQMKNIEAIITDESLSAETKVYSVIQVMSYLNMLVKGLIQPLREEAGDTDLIKMIESTFTEFLAEDEGWF